MSKHSLFDLQGDLVKTIIKDTVETYSGQWRIAHEALQNSHDAIQLNPSIKNGLIEIELHIGTNLVRVKDNGTGIDSQKFKNVFLLGGSDKAYETTARKLLKGSQGVGIKATLFTSEYFKIVSVHGNHSWEIELINCHDFLNPEFIDDLIEPRVSDSSLPSGTTLEYRLHDFSVADFINEVLEEHFEDVYIHDEQIENQQLALEQVLKVLEVYFRAKTYVGCVQSLLEINPRLKPVEVKLSLHLDANTLKEHRSLEIKQSPALSEDVNHGKTFTWHFPGKYLDMLEIHSSLDKKDRADKVYKSFEDVLENPPAETLKKLLIQKFDKDQAKRLLYRFKKKEDGTRGLEQDNVLMQKHRKVLDMLNGIYLVIGPRPYLSKYFWISTKQLLSVNGLPTNIVLNPPRGALSYLNNVHILIDVDTKLGLGKRNIPGRTMGLINNFFVDIWSTLRKVAPSIVGLREGRDPSTANIWDKEIEYEKYNNRDNILLNKPLFMKTVPEEEQEVIALFFELIGRKTITGYFPFRLAINNIYDGLFYIDVSSKGSFPASLKSRFLKIVEFKYKLSSLVKDFQEEIKYLDDIDLVVCWENDCEDDSEYTVSSLERDNIDPLPAATLRVRRGTKSCQVIVLKDFLESLELKG